MKALTLTQPWATLVAIGAKEIETRSWHTSYRGPLAIHAAKGLAGMKRIEFSQLCLLTEPFRTALRAAGYYDSDSFPRGRVLATCELVDCLETQAIEVGEPERSFGDYSYGRFAWLLENIRRLPGPVPAKGALGLWEWQP